MGLPSLPTHSPYGGGVRPTIAAVVGHTSMCDIIWSRYEPCGIFARRPHDTRRTESTFEYTSLLAAERRHSGIRPSILPCTVIGCDDDDGVRCFGTNRIHDAADVDVQLPGVEFGVIAELRLAPKCRVRVGRVLHLHEVDVHEEGFVVLRMLLDVRHRRNRPAARRSWLDNRR